MLGNLCPRARDRGSLAAHPRDGMKGHTKCVRNVSAQAFKLQISRTRRTGVQGALGWAIWSLSSESLRFHFWVSEWHRRIRSGIVQSQVVGFTQQCFLISSTRFMGSGSKGYELRFETTGSLLGTYLQTWLARKGGMVQGFGKLAATFALTI